ncbi:hypothetical protein CCR75_007574 [Bremia lactucae]|uniref:TAFII28-like protein domain-containing protein n=1 Tax=Bremia lactucae TaxID=4779 RepID=A0A976IAM5_BRELC|nr:hypothetical protein CCR75_007574 [Bremia lactucae]
MVEPSGLQGTDEEDEVRFLETRNEDLILVDKTQHSTADEEEEGEEDDESESEEDKMGLSNSASMLRIMRSLPEAEARRYEHFRRSHFERGAIKRVTLLNAAVMK